MTQVPDTLLAKVRAELSTAQLGDVLDTLGRRHQFLPPEICSAMPGATLVGRAMPLLEVAATPDDHSFGLMFEALDSLGKNEVYVAAAGAPPFALWGELMTTRAQAQGAAGAVLDGYMRDTREIRAMTLPVFARGSYAQDQRGRGRVVAYREPVRIAEVAVRPGDLIVGDDDGVLVVRVTSRRSASRRRWRSAAWKTSLPRRSRPACPPPRPGRSTASCRTLTGGRSPLVGEPPVQLGLEVREQRVERGHERDDDSQSSLSVAAPAHVAFQEARERAVAAALLEAREADVRFEGGRYRIAGTDRSTGFAEVVRASFDPSLRPEAETLGLDCEVNHVAPAVTFANGCHVCEVEIERATGLVRIVRYTAVDDFGRILNPLLAEGQNHGAVAQGIGQALTEHAVYDAVSGQLIAGSFMDYTLPRADDLPLFDGHFAMVPCLTNPLGVKGCGEAGSIVAPAAVMNAVADALRDHGGHERVEMPATPEAIWRILHGQPATGPKEGTDAT